MIDDHVVRDGKQPRPRRRLAVHGGKRFLCAPEYLLTNVGNIFRVADAPPDESPQPLPVREDELRERSRCARGGPGGNASSAFRSWFHDDFLLRRLRRVGLLLVFAAVVAGREGVELELNPDPRIRRDSFRELQVGGVL